MASMGQKYLVVSDNHGNMSNLEYVISSSTQRPNFNPSSSTFLADDGRLTPELYTL